MLWTLDDNDDPLYEDEEEFVQLPTCPTCGGQDVAELPTDEYEVLKFVCMECDDVFQIGTESED